MSSQRGDVVVRVRVIAENIASGHAAAAQSSANSAASVAQEARSRAATHPLSRSTGPLGAAEVMTAVGVASALRENALSAQRRFELADQSLDEARANVSTATARRKAAERLVLRRVGAVAREEQRRTQRSLDEGAAGMRRPR
jgi:cell pole-organizing protein PopZ